MKKIFAFVLSIIMAAACMAACSPSNSAPASDADGQHWVFEFEGKEALGDG